ncbi:MAG TPA: ATP-binding protein [bacterium]|nr:ATP-binding protein [bacterium]
MLTFRLLRRSTAPREARWRIRPRLRELGYPDDVVDELLVAVGEAMTNAVLYGAPGPDSQAADDIAVTLRTDAAFCVIEVTSPKTGWAVNLATCPGPMAPNGRGLFVIDRFTDAWKVTQGPGGTTISLSRRLPAPMAERAGRV